jgi:hypothetical protein
VGPFRALLLLAIGAVACGPSFQAVYECDVHFEHCYALDQGVGGPDPKKDCWRDWLHGYTYGQPRDRVEYAATRFSELSLDPTLPSEDVAVAHPRRSARSVAAPMPTNAFAPPPNTLEGHPVAAPPSETAAAAVRPPAAVMQAPGSECADACSVHWKGCRESCKDGACETCDRAYRGCMPACFREESDALHPAKGSR